MSSALIAKQTGLVFAGPVGSLDAYIDRVSQIAVLSKERRGGAGDAVSLGR